MGKVYCQICSKRCKGDVLKVHDKFIHKSCFLCCCCRASLEKGGFFLKEEKYYCKKDYLDKFGVKCQVCNEIAEGEVIVIFATTFHPNCFKCRKCLAVFQRGDKVTLCNGEHICYRCVAKQNNQRKEEKEIIPQKPDETLTLKKENNSDELDAMTTSLISTIVSDSSENESTTPEKRNLIGRSINSSSKLSKIESTYTKSGGREDFSSDSECMSIRTEPEMSRYNVVQSNRPMRNSDYSGSTCSLRPSQSPMQFGRFYNFSYLKLEENLKNQIHPKALYKHSRTDISTSSNNIHHYHKLDNFSYRSSPNVTMNKKPTRSYNLNQVINGKKAVAPNQSLIDSEKQFNADSKENSVKIVKPAFMNGSTPSIVTGVSSSSLIDVTNKNPALTKEIQTKNPSVFPMKNPRPSTVLDPISASRAPSASYEPLPRPRFDMHMFTSPSRQLTQQEASELFTLSLNAENHNKDVIDSAIVRPQSQLEIKPPIYKPKASVTRSQVICSKPQDQDYISVQSFLRSYSREKLFEDRKPKVYPYEELKVSNFIIPKGVDRSKLEIYLSEEEFEKIFRLSRTAFNRLPEWKRNDLKKRMDLF